MCRQSIFIWLLMSISTFCGAVTARAQTDAKVNRIMIRFGGQHADAVEGGFANLKTGEVYHLNEATKKQGDVDLVYAYGETTAINLMTPSSSSVGLFGSRYRTQVVERWEVKNSGTLVAAGNTKALRKSFKTIKTNKQLIQKYNAIVKSLPEQDYYNQKNHGPSARIRELAIGDYVLFRSRSKERGMYAVGRVVGLEKGTRGEVMIDFKITKE